MPFSVNSPIFQMVISPVLVAGSLTLGTIGLAPQSAQAALFARDLNSVGDALLTRDTLTGLDWLDVTQTKGRSYEEVLAGFGGYTSQQGFRFATVNEVSALFSSVLGGKAPVIFSNSNADVNLSREYFAAEEINILLGQTSSQQFSTGVSQGRFRLINTQGYVVDPTTSSVALATISSTRQTATPTIPFVGRFLSDRGTGSFSMEAPQGSLSSQYASFLVRSSAPVASTPEPSVLLATVAIALAGLAQRRSNSPEG